jgi:hypothetical protein
VKRQGKLMLLMMVDGDMDLLLLVRVKKKKGKKSRALPTERKKEWNVNQIIQTMYQHGKNQILLLLL